MKAQEISKLICDWNDEVMATAQAEYESADKFICLCYEQVKLYECECDRLPDDKNLEDILVNEVYPNYDEAYKQRKEAEDRLERAERVMEALKELQVALEDWEA